MGYQVPPNTFEQQHPGYPLIRLLDWASQTSVAWGGKRGLCGEYFCRWLRVGQRPNKNTSKNSSCSELSEPTSVSGEMFTNTHTHSYLDIHNFHQWVLWAVNKHTEIWWPLQMLSDVIGSPGLCFPTLRSLASASSSHCCWKAANTNRTWFLFWVQQERGRKTDKMREREREPCLPEGPSSNNEKDAAQVFRRRN